MCGQRRRASRRFVVFPQARRFPRRSAKDGIDDSHGGRRKPRRGGNRAFTYAEERASAYR